MSAEGACVRTSHLARLDPAAIRLGGKQLKQQMTIVAPFWRRSVCDNNSGAARTRQN